MTQLHPKKLDAKSVFLALSDPNTLATTVHIILLSSYGEAIYDTDPIDLYLRLEEDFGVKPTEEIENRINAILMATSTDLFFNDPQAFTAVCETILNGDPGLDVLDPLTLPEIMWGIYEVELNRTPAHMSKSVERIIHEAMETEAGDPETEDLFGSDSYGYLMRFLEEQREVLRTQLENLGLPAVDLPPIQGNPPPQIQVQ
jgi:hypothetical protein